MIEKLKKFCHKEDHAFMRDWGTEPFSDGHYTYATNGHILIRVPNDESAGQKTPNVPWENLFKVLTFNHDEISDWLEIEPPRLPEMVPCDHCGGGGKVKFCPECDGDGEVHFENDYNEYTWGCETCNGTGRARGHDCDCPICDGGGKIWGSNDKVKIGENYLNPFYLRRLLEAFSGVEFSQANQFDGESYRPVPFRFDGGVGFLMPMMPPAGIRR